MFLLNDSLNNSSVFWLLDKNLLASPFNLLSKSFTCFLVSLLTPSTLDALLVAPFNVCFPNRLINFLGIPNAVAALKLAFIGSPNKYPAPVPIPPVILAAVLSC